MSSELLTLLSSSWRAVVSTSFGSRIFLVDFYVVSANSELPKVAGEGFSSVVTKS